MSDNLSRLGKIIAGFLLIFFTAASSYLLIGLWPDRLPDSTNPKCDAYSFRLFNVRLLDGKSSCADSAIAVKDTASENIPATADTPVANVAGQPDTPVAKTEAAKKETKEPARKKECMHKCTIHLDNLLLILVALAGFMGNLIHIATSFTTYIGSGKYTKSWLLWYFVRPFTAAALALTLYFAFRAGFMNYSSSGGNLNLYGVMTVAILSGLFTDMATLKLKEIFEVMFKPKDERKDKLNEPADGGEQQSS